MSGGWHFVGLVVCLVGWWDVGMAVFCGCCGLGVSATRLCVSGDCHIVVRVAVLLVMCERWLAHSGADGDWGCNV